MDTKTYTKNVERSNSRRVLLCNMCELFEDQNNEIIVQNGNRRASPRKAYSSTRHIRNIIDTTSRYNADGQYQNNKTSSHEFESHDVVQSSEKDASSRYMYLQSVSTDAPVTPVEDIGHDVTYTDNTILESHNESNVGNNRTSYNDLDLVPDYSSSKLKSETIVYQDSSEKKPDNTQKYQDVPVTSSTSIISPQSEVRNKTDMANKVQDVSAKEKKPVAIKLNRAETPEAITTSHMLSNLDENSVQKINIKETKLKEVKFHVKSTLPMAIEEMTAFYKQTIQYLKTEYIVQAHEVYIKLCNLVATTIKNNNLTVGCVLFETNERDEPMFGDHKELKAINRTNRGLLIEWDTYLKLFVQRKKRYNDSRTSTPRSRSEGNTLLNEGLRNIGLESVRLFDSLSGLDKAHNLSSHPLTSKTDITKHEREIRQQTEEFTNSLGEGRTSDNSTTVTDFTKHPRLSSRYFQLTDLPIVLFELLPENLNKRENNRVNRQLKPTMDGEINPNIKLPVFLAVVLACSSVENAFINVSESEAEINKSFMGLKPFHALLEIIVNDPLLHRLQYDYNQFAMNRTYLNKGLADKSWKHAKYPSYELWYTYTESGNLVSVIEGILNASLFSTLAIIRESDLHGEWIPFLQESHMVYEVSPFSQVVSQVIKLPWPLQDRETVFVGAGFDCLSSPDDKCIMLVGQSMPDDATSYLGLPIQPKQAKKTRLHLEAFTFCFYPSSDPQKTLTKQIMAVDPRISYIPSSIQHAVVRQLVSKLFSNIQKLAKSFNGSIYESRVQQNTHVYGEVKNRLNTFYSRR